MKRIVLISIIVFISSQCLLGQNLTSDVYQDEYIYAYIKPKVRQNEHYDEIIIRNHSNVTVSVTTLYRVELRNEYNDVCKADIREDFITLQPGWEHSPSIYLQHTHQCYGKKHHYLAVGYRIMKVSPVEQNRQQSSQPQYNSSQASGGSSSRVSNGENMNKQSQSNAVTFKVLVNFEDSKPSWKQYYLTLYQEQGTRTRTYKGQLKDRNGSYKVELRGKLEWLDSGEAPYEIVLRSSATNDYLRIPLGNGLDYTKYDKITGKYVNASGQHYMSLKKE